MDLWLLGTDLTAETALEEPEASCQAQDPSFSVQWPPGTPSYIVSTTGRQPIQAMGGARRSALACVVVLMEATSLEHQLRGKSVRVRREFLVHQLMHSANLRSLITPV